MSLAPMDDIPVDRGALAIRISNEFRQADPTRAADVRKRLQCGDWKGAISALAAWETDAAFNPALKCLQIIALYAATRGQEEAINELVGCLDAMGGGSMPTISAAILAGDLLNVQANLTQEQSRRALKAVFAEHLEGALTRLVVGGRLVDLEAFDAESSAQPKLAATYRPMLAAIVLWQQLTNDAPDSRATPVAGL